VSPRVLVDATAVAADRGGVGRYVDGLVGALAAADADLAVACQRVDEDRYGRIAPDARIVPGPGAIAHRPARLAWEQAGLPLVAQQVEADLIHSPHYTMPVTPGRPVVATLHDATWFTNPEYHTAMRVTFFRSATRTALRRAVRCIVPSKATREEMVRLLDADATKIDVAYHGVDHTTFYPPTEAEARRVSDRLGLHGRPYVAFLGVLEPRRNVAALVRGWVQAIEGLDVAPALVLAGGAGWDDEVDAAVAAVPAGLTVLRPGYLPFRDLRGYLGGATVVAYPSYGEGFGLPVIEAMACGAPVLTTPRLSLPEVGGDAVAYTEPSVEAIGRALRGLLDDAGRREALGRAGYERSLEFTWEQSAEAHLSTYERAIAGDNAPAQSLR
jgi:glycosyltransferase involved in cell wall biosynthesis